MPRSGSILLNCISFFLLYLCTLVSAQITETKIFPVDGAAQDHFGRASALSGDYALIGAMLDDERTGSAYIFKRNGLAWEEQAKLKGSDTHIRSEQGRSVAIDGDYAVVGAQGQIANGTKTGAVYIFRNDDGAWPQVARLVASDGEQADHFGAAVGISGSYLVVGAYGNDETASDAGAAYVFHFDGTNWVEEAKLLAGDGAAFAEFGFSVAISGTRAIVGAWMDENATGAAYIFEEDGSSWTQQAKLTASDGVAGDQFGSWWISIDGDYALVGALNHDNDKGASYVFYYDGLNWSEQAKLVPDEAAPEDHFGTSNSIDGDHAVIGTFEGEYAYIYRRNATNWEPLAKLTASDGGPGNDFGYTAAISGDWVLVGADDQNIYGNSSGAVYLFNGFLDNLIVHEIPDQTVESGEIFEAIYLDDFVTDPLYADEQIVWSASGYTDLLVDIDAERVATISIPDTTWTGSEVIIFTAINPEGDTAGDEAVFTVSGTGGATAPDVTDIPDATVANGPRIVRITLDNYVDDPDHSDDELVWTISGNIDLTVIYRQNVRVAKILSPEGWIGSETLTFIATDPSGQSDTDTARFTVTGVAQQPVRGPNLVYETPRLFPNHPNPFNPTTRFEFRISNFGFVEINLYDVQGRLVKTLVSQSMDAGSYTASWDGKNDAGRQVASGIYLYQLVSGSFVQTRKMLLTH